ncbi:DUF1439 domain-containing protein [Ramlibacter sp. USB13]|uniref:DUF1439 domain-containing protein n=1 Tax=Ramlibacter cellulosilyticus TaxID=2764187 RepID=A0A923MSQ1_9BURK|nr:DUF1439 domain-containing protein [Ramlibacter cellulosilyticus]MBC5783914.1 DUF1439 domain-containing protein [Ramlibacter cellulosilyticus]
MRRRLLVTALACAPAFAQEPPESPRPRQKVSAAQIYEALSRRFPVKRGLGGLLELVVSAPGLLLLPARNKIGASLRVEASGPALRTPQVGDLDLVFALRYEASDQTLRAYEPEVLDLRLPGTPPESAQAIRALLPRITRDLGEFVLHQFTPRELALPDTMGFKPDRVTVLEDGLEVSFAPKGS